MEYFKNYDNVDDLIKKAAREIRFDATVTVKVFVENTGNEELDKQTAYESLKEYLELVPNAEIIDIERVF